MVFRRIVWLLGFALLAPGCSLLQNSTRTLIVEPLHYCNFIQDHKARAIYRASAREAWDAMLEENVDQTFSEDYASGFQEGFADFLYAGGTGEPPPLPPRKYWKNKFATPQGRQAVEDWFAGFRHGAAMAQQSGCRFYVEVPTSVSERHATDWQSHEFEKRHTYEFLPAPTPDSLSNKHPNTSLKSNSLATFNSQVPNALTFSRHTGTSTNSNVAEYETSETTVREIFVPNRLEGTNDAILSTASRPVRLPSVSR